jgi:hypothetical protein
MSTAELAPHHTFDENVAAIVRTLMAMRDLDPVHLAPQVGMTKSTLYNRLDGAKWLAQELDRIAAYFDVSPAIFYRPVEELTQNWKGMMRPDLRVLPGGKTKQTPRQPPLLHVLKP